MRRLVAPRSRSSRSSARAPTTNRHRHHHLVHHDHHGAGDTTSSTAPPPVPHARLDRARDPGDRRGRRAHRAGGAARSLDLYIAEKGGRVRLIEVEEDQFGDDEGELTYELQTTPLLDISDEVINEGERGLLGMAFSSDGRKLYLDYTRQPDGHTVVVEYTLGDGKRIDDDSRREVLFVEQPFANHNGGHLAVGPDGYLYISLGDGGAGGDPLGHGQDTATLLGSILRIDPEGGTEDGPAYAIPPGNPFADGEDGAPEIWLYGARNPWRFSFDTATGDLWIGDVGQDEYEEIDRLPADGGFDAGKGANLGWNEMEGTHPYDGGENPDGRRAADLRVRPRPGLLRPRWLRVPRRGHPRPPGHVPLLGLLRHGRARAPGRRRHRDRLPHVGPPDRSRSTPSARTTPARSTCSSRRPHRQARHPRAPGPRRPTRRGALDRPPAGSCLARRAP